MRAVVKVNAIAEMAPVLLSVIAFGVAVFAGVSGIGHGAKDEGPLAHIFHLLIAAEVPIIALFIATRGQRRMRSFARPLALQIGAAAAAFAPVAFFSL